MKIQSVVIISALVFYPLILRSDTSDNSLLNKFVDFGFKPELSTFYSEDGKVILKRFGKPVKIEKFYYPDNREPQLQNVEIIYRYKGLEITIFGPKKSKRLWIRELVLTSNKYELVGGLKIGQNISSFMKILGSPVSRNYNILHYTFKNDQNEFVVFAGINTTMHYADGVVYKIIWTVADFVGQD